MTKPFLVDYIHWHYSRALRDGWRIYATLVWFVLNFFAVQFHLRTLFSRFEKLGEPYPHGFVLGKIIASFLVNTLMRLVGALIRLTVIIAGIIALTITAFFGFLLFLLWLSFPIAIAALWIIGLLLMLGV